MSNLNNHEKELARVVKKYRLVSKGEHVKGTEWLVGFAFFMPSDGGLADVRFVADYQINQESTYQETKSKIRHTAIRHKLQGRIHQYAKLYMYHVVNGKFKLVVESLATAQL